MPNILAASSGSYSGLPRAECASLDLFNRKRTAKHWTGWVRADSIGKRSGLDDARWPQDRRALDRIAQLANVSGPRIAL